MSYDCIVPPYTKEADSQIQLHKKVITVTISTNKLAVKIKWNRTTYAVEHAIEVSESYDKCAKSIAN